MAATAMHSGYSENQNFVGFRCHIREFVHGAAALLPMLFVSGLMGPYMAPIPVNASAAMLFSFFVAMVIAPWLMVRLQPQGNAPHAHEAAYGEGILGRLYRAWLTRSCAHADRLGRS